MIPLDSCPLVGSTSAVRRRNPRRLGRTRGEPAARIGSTLVTRGADYAVRALVHLATLPPERRLSHTVLAAAIDAPEIFVGKLLQQLAGAGYVVSRRGKGGGVRLRRTALRASLLDVITTIDGPPALNRCVSDEIGCDRSSWCPVYLVWREAQQRVTDVLGSITIASLAAAARHTQEIGSRGDLQEFRR